MQSFNVTTHKGLPVLLTEGPFEAFPESVQHYIMDTWVLHHAKFFKQGDWREKKAVKARLRSRVKAVLDQPATRILVATFPNEEQAGRLERAGEDRIIGWLVCGPRPAIHYLYVRDVYRHGGAGHLMLAVCMVGGAPRFFATHWARELPKDGVYREEESGLEVFYCGFDPLTRCFS